MAIPKSNTIQICLGQSSPPFPGVFSCKLPNRKEKKRKEKNRTEKKGQTLKT
jgi:hypothetical protein